MSRIPRVTGSDLIAALGNAGFAVIRVKGGHHFLRHEDGRTTVVPAHAGETIGPHQRVWISPSASAWPYRRRSRVTDDSTSLTETACSQIAPAACCRKAGGRKPRRSEKRPR